MSSRRCLISCRVAERVRDCAMKMEFAQESFLEPIIVDNFAGGGGASTGIELATGRIVNIAINHDPDAILMHKTNHPHTEHYQASVWDVDPREVCRGRPVALAWFSPDCKHFSKAKGAALMDRNIRGLAWIVLRWAGTVRPRIIILENVEEFVTWGPVRKGKPVRKLAGQTFLKWKGQLEDLGYKVDHRKLVAADYGAPTIRKRLVLIARCDGEPIVWPEPTHASADSEGVRTGAMKPWRSAAEIIDWSLPMYSVFDSKEQIKERYGVTAVRPLAGNTMRRIIRGVDKFTIRSGNPFLVECNHSGDGHITDAGCPVGTVTQKCTMGVCDSVLAPVTFSNTNGSVGFSADMPVHTITSDGKQVLAAAQLIQYHTEQAENVRGSKLTGPIHTIDAANRYALVSAHLTEYYGNGVPLDLRDPMHTATGHDREALVASHIVEFKGQDKGQSPERPLLTITASAGEFALCDAIIRKYAIGENVGRWPEIRKLLNQHCGYHLQDDEIILLMIGGAAYFIFDILLRMLSPRELYAAMGFPDDYIIDHDYMGNKYGKAKQVARCGNAVCPPMAAAVVRANWKETAVWNIEMMAELERRVAI